MESDDAGLKTVEAIRQKLGNTMVRIILRTGQPGSAPETEVIKRYDINDYKEKTELTAQKLFTTIISSLRSYRDLRTIYQSRLGLEKIIDSSRDLLTLHSAKQFSEGVLTQLISMLKFSPNSILLNAGDAFSVHHDKNNYTILAATGTYHHQTIETLLSNEVKTLLDEAVEKHENIHKNDVCVYFIETSKGQRYLIYLPGCQKIDDIDKGLLGIFMANTAVMYENLLLNNEIIDTQKEIIERLGEVVENRSHDTARHVYRVAEISYLLAIAYGLGKEEAEMIRMAAPMHDIGKVSMPDSILLKQGSLNEGELVVMKEHAQIGFEIMGKSERDILKSASTIAYEHHEKWDGTGYPRGLKGEEIHLYGRIVAIADVFDALCQTRSYKDAWPIERVFEYIKEERGKHFEPKIVDLFFENLDEIMKIR
jgi:response regulator RpfG family c-di-GMP phosphodiesterase